MSVLSKNELIRELEYQLPSSRKMSPDRIEKQRLNTNTIHGLKRDGLSHGSFERRMLIYSTLSNEKIYIEYPGKESVATKAMPYDTCPGLANESSMITLDTSFGDIWDVIDYLGKNHKAYLPILASILIYMSNMLKYRNVDKLRECFDITIRGEDKKYTAVEPIQESFYELNLTKREWKTLNDMFDGISIRGHSLSFEAFIKYFDVLLMNEDSKYAYKAILNGQTLESWKYQNGRTKTIGTCLNLIGYFSNQISISDLLNKFQNGRGTMSFPVKKYSEISNNIITHK